jgi:hypothetical protein|tara:strand:+ start:125 stop:832 length:708 start_codon:yes stop_codon:yes gene_type:complete
LGRPKIKAEGKQVRILALIHSIKNYLEAHGGGMLGVDLTLNKLATTGMSDKDFIDTPPQGTRHDEILDSAMAGIKAPHLQEIATCLAAAKNDLVWREDNSQYYSPDANLGEGYSECNLHTLLIGPDACGFHNSDFILGVFLLGPRTLYRDHNHAAPELYLNLAKKSGWRLNFGDWQDYPAGSLIWNNADEIHATKTYDQPFISVFVWLEKINSKCNVVFSKDWAEIEKDLAKGSN